MKSTIFNAFISQFQDYCLMPEELPKEERPLARAYSEQCEAFCCGFICKFISTDHPIPKEIAEKPLGSYEQIAAITALAEGAWKKKTSDFRENFLARQVSNHYLRRLQNASASTLTTDCYEIQKAAIDGFLVAMVIGGSIFWELPTWWSDTSCDPEHKEFSSHFLTFHRHCSNTDLKPYFSAICSKWEFYGQRRHP